MKTYKLLLNNSILTISADNVTWNRDSLNFYRSDALIAHFERDSIIGFVEDLGDGMNIQTEYTWIPVSEKLPDIHNYTKQYLVTLDDGTICIDMFTETNGRSWWICENVVAWMPLPEAYKNDIKYYLS